MGIYDFTKIQTLKRKMEAEQDRDISFEEMATAMKISEGTLRNLAFGRADDALGSTIVKIARYFEVPMEFFISDEFTEGNRLGPTRSEVEPIAFAAS